MYVVVVHVGIPTTYMVQFTKRGLSVPSLRRLDLAPPALSQRLILEFAALEREGEACEDWAGNASI